MKNLTHEMPQILKAPWCAWLILLILAIPHDIIILGNFLFLFLEKVENYWDWQKEKEKYLITTNFRNKYRYLIIVIIV